MEEAIDVRQRAVISMLKQEATVEPMEELGQEMSDRGL